jgi:hypothetical protein
VATKIHRIKEILRKRFEARDCYEQQRPDVRRLWQGQVVEGTSMSLEELRNALVRLNRVEHRRTLVGGLFCVLFLGACGALLIGAAPIRAVRDVEWVFAIGAGFFFFQVILGCDERRESC